MFNKSTLTCRSTAMRASADNTQRNPVKSVSVGYYDRVTVAINIWIIYTEDRFSKLHDFSIQPCSASDSKYHYESAFAVEAN